MRGHRRLLMHDLQKVIPAPAPGADGPAL